MQHLYSLGAYDWEIQREILFESEKELTKAELTALAREVFVESMVESVSRNRDKSKMGAFYSALDVFYIRNNSKPQIRVSLEKRGYRIIEPENTIAIWDITPHKYHNEDWDQEIELQKEIDSEVRKQLANLGIEIYSRKTLKV